MHSRGTEHQYDLPQEPLLIHWCILPIEMGVRSLRTVLESEIPEADWLQSKYD